MGIPGGERKLLSVWDEKGIIRERVEGRNTKGPISMERNASFEGPRLQLSSFQIQRLITKVLIPIERLRTDFSWPV